MAVYFDQFFYVLHADAGQIYPDIGNCCLYIREITGKRLVGSLICGQFFNRSSHPNNVYQVCFFSFFI